MIRSIFIDCGPLPRSDEHSWKAKSDTALQVNRTVYEAYYPRCIGWHPKQEPSSTASGMVKTWDGTPASRFWNVFMVKTSLQPTSLSNTPLLWVLVFGLIYDAFDFDRLWTETDAIDQFKLITRYMRWIPHNVAETMHWTRTYTGFGVVKTWDGTPPSRDCVVFWYKLLTFKHTIAMYPCTWFKLSFQVMDLF